MSVDMVETKNEGLKALLAAAEVEAQIDTFFASVDAKAERVLLAQRLRSLAEAIVVAAVGEADLAHVGERHDCRNAADFVAQRTSVSPAVVRADAKLASWLRDFSEIAGAFACGAISRRHVDELRKADNLRTGPLMRAQQAMLVDHATSLPWHEFTVALRYWLIANDPDGAEPREQHREARVRTRKHRDGTVTGDFRLDPIAGRAFLQAFESELERIRCADADTEVERNRSERTIAAFMALIARGYARPNGSVPAPLVNIVLGERVAEQLLARITEQTSAAEPFDIDPDDVNRRCELIDGTPLHPHHVAGVLAIGEFRRHVFDAAERIVETSPSRSFPKELRHLFHLESRGRCAVRGCDAPFSSLQADHRMPSSKGGPTSHGNGQNLCGPHNRHKGARVVV